MSYRTEQLYFAGRPPSVIYGDVEALRFNKQTHLVLGWGTSRCDEYALSRILRNKDDLLCPRNGLLPFELETFNIGAFLARLTGLKHVNPGLSYVYFRLFTEKERPIGGRGSDHSR
jgi:hypothetical protein